ncbi:MAG: hypothetical protein LBT51_08015 [Fusobacteriaceae bacterium]|jgi:hypothetical protein|nr:hypothetical protein [Fusobacteriaceae bacterium]
MKDNEVYRYGIDKIALFNFKFETDGKWKVQHEDRDNQIIEKIIIKDELFSIVSAYAIYFDENGEAKEKYFDQLQFNPNKVLEGHNVRNSNTTDLSNAIKKLKKILESKQIYIDLSNAKIMEIELNINIPIDFDEYKTVFQLFINQFNAPKFIGRFIKSEKLEDCRADESYFTKINKKSTFIIYSKDVESKLRQKITRLEYRYSNDTYRYMTNIYSMTNSLEDLLNHPEMIKILFLHNAKKQFMHKTFTYIEQNIKPILEREYIRFKATNKFARKNKKKESRDIYKYLSQYNIFDYSFLIELISKFDQEHLSREAKVIMHKYGHYDNLERLNFVLNYLLTTETT